MLRDRQNDKLDRGNRGRQHQTVVVAVGHNDRADETGGHAPRGLVDVLELIILIGELDIKRSGKAVAEIV